MEDGGVYNVIDDRYAMYMSQYIAFASLTCLVWEWAISLSFEVSTIWRSCTPRWTRFVYVYPRYIGLASLLGNVVLVNRLHAKYEVEAQTCRWWNAYQRVVLDSMLLVLEVLLAARVYALFDRKRSVGIFLTLMLIFKTAAVVALDIMSVLMIEFDDGCLVASIPWTLICVSAIGLVVQSTIWGMTLFKHVKVLVRNGWRNIPLLSLVTRDGSWAFVFLAVLLLSSMRDAISSLLLGYPNLNARLCRELMFPLTVATISFVNCRMIMNMRRFSTELDEHTDDRVTNGLQLTTLPVSWNTNQNQCSRY